MNADPSRQDSANTPKPFPAPGDRPATEQTTKVLSEHPAPVAVKFDSIPGYQLLEQIHRGGQGVVFRAMQHSTQRQVAIKVMKEGPFADAHERARFEREVRLLAKLKHPNIVTIHDSGEAGGCFYLVMDYIAGLPLGHYIRPLKEAAGPGTDPAMPIRDRLALFAKICDAIQAAHERGIIHRDLKPGNIRLDEKGEPHILDFGLAKSTAAVADDAEAVTVAGQFFGSVPWASPEQAEGAMDKTDARSDVYSLGVILYQLLTGSFPYEVRGSAREVLDRIVTVEPVRPRTLNPHLDRDLETIVLKCLQKDQGRRYQSAGEIAKDLRHYQAGEPIEARRDSVAYVARTQTRAAIARHPVASVLTLAVFVSLLLASPEVDTFVSHQTQLDATFERFLARHFPPVPVGKTFDQVRVIAMTGATDMPAIAKKMGLSDVSPSNKRSLRRVHGRLMERLAVSGCGVVALDLVFENESAFDTDVVAGIRALRKADVPVVVAVYPWRLDDTGAPGIAPLLKPEVRAGCVVSALSGRSSWKLQLAAQRGERGFQPSLALATFAAYRHPQDEIDIRQADTRQPAIDVQYFVYDIGTRLPKHWKEPDHVELTAIMTGGTALEGFAPEYGLGPNDTVGYYYLDMPADDVLATSTIKYEDVFAADDHRLREWFRGKAIIVGDFRGKADQFRHPDGRMIPGPYAHAAGLDGLLRDIPVRLPRSIGAMVLPSLGGLIACVIAWAIPRRHAMRGLVLVFLTAGFVLTAIVAYRQWRYLFNPLVPVVALWIVGVAGAALQRINRRTN